MYWAIRLGAESLATMNHPRSCDCSFVRFLRCYPRAWSTGRLLQNKPYDPSPMHCNGKTRQAPTMLQTSPYIFRCTVTVQRNFSSPARLTGRIVSAARNVDVAFACSVRTARLRRRLAGKDHVSLDLYLSQPSAAGQMS